jgi:hypothetical protein
MQYLGTWRLEHLRTALGFPLSKVYSLELGFEMPGEW